MAIAVGPTGTVAAASQPVVSATSPTTGITYTGTYSCIEQRPSFTATRPTALSYVQLQGVANGSVVYEQSQYVDHRDADSRVAFDVAGVPRTNRQTAQTFQLRDTFAVGQSPGPWGPVFLTITPAACPDYSAGAPSRFVPIAPTRVLDTRPATAVNYSGAKPADNASVTVQATAMPERPAGVTAVSLTLTLVAPSAGGFGQVYPSGSAVPGASSNVNTAGAGVTTANAAIVPVAGDGSISVFVNRSSHILVDINGYFVAQPAAVAGGRLASITPKRVFDTRSSGPVNSSGVQPASGSTTRVDLTAQTSGLPPGATAAIVNITATGTTGAGYVQAAAGGTLVPGVSSMLNIPAAGRSIAGMTIVPLAADGSIDIFTLTGTDLIVDLTGWFTSDTATASRSGLFVPVPPERIRDTRRATSLNQVTFGGSGGCCGSSSNVLGYTAVGGLASAVVLNVTAIGGRTGGFIQIGASDRKFSTVNFPGTGAVANAAVIPLSPTDTCCARSSMTAAFGTFPDMAVDISGYFTK